MSKTMYFILDATHNKVNKLLNSAETLHKANAYGAELSWYYNNDQTKAEMKVVGPTDDWYTGSGLFNHPAILQTFTMEQHGDLLTILQDPEWKVGGSPYV